MKWAVIYLWRGERHRVLAEFESAASANTVVLEMRKNGWQVWTEPARGAA